MIAGDLPATMSGDSGYGISSTGSIYTMGADHRSIQVFSPDGLALDGTITGMTVDQARCVVLRDGAGREHLFTQHDFYDTFYSMTLSGVSGLIEEDVERQHRLFVLAATSTSPTATAISGCCGSTSDRADLSLSRGRHRRPAGIAWGSRG
jgi:hypothetical protein